MFSITFKCALYSIPRLAKFNICHAYAAEHLRVLGIPSCFSFTFCTRNAFNAGKKTEDKMDYSFVQACILSPCSKSSLVIDCRLVWLTLINNLNLVKG